MEEAMDFTIGALTGGCFPLSGYTVGAIGTSGFTEGAGTGGHTGAHAGGHHTGDNGGV